MLQGTGQILERLRQSLFSTLIKAVQFVGSHRAGI
jgi:hypothetical protein